MKNEREPGRPGSLSFFSPQGINGMARVTSAGVLLYRRVSDEQYEVLLTLPAGNQRHKKWGIPKGQLNPGEALLAAAVRECWEEIGVQVDASTCEYLTDTKFPKRSKVVHAFVAPYPDGQVPKLDPSEIAAYQWVTLSAARALVHEPQLKFLVAFQSYVDQKPR